VSFPCCREQKEDGKGSLVNETEMVKSQNPGEITLSLLEITGLIESLSDSYFDTLSLYFSL
jgi:hypothetical protein